MKATRIRMKPNSSTSSSLLEIASIYIEGTTNEGFYDKEYLHDYLVKNPGTIKVNIRPYPDLIPAKSSNNEKYVKSTPNDRTKDNLLNLPRG